MGVGAFAVLVVFIAVVLSRAGISEVRNGFHYLMSDPEHQMDLKYKISKYFERFYRYYKYQILVTGACLVVGFLKDSRIVRFMKMDCFLLAVAAAIAGIYFAVTKLIEKKKAKNADDRENYVSCSCLDEDFVSETVAE